MMPITESQQQKENRKKINRSSEIHGIVIKELKYMSSEFQKKKKESRAGRVF